jgi:hypothetical protein
MQRVPVSSTNIRSIGYDCTSEILEIEFHSVASISTILYLSPSMKS